MMHKFCSKILLGVYGLAVIVACLMAVPNVRAQSLLNAQSMALGGGSAYLSGPETTFNNPANLMVDNRYGDLHISMGQLGGAFQPVLAQHSLRKQINNFSDIFSPYGHEKIGISQDDRQQILRDNYPDSQQRSQHHAISDILLGGVSWQTKDAAFSVALRMRKGSRIEVGKGWYSDRTSADSLRDFTLNQQKSSLYELSVGYAQKFTFYNGLLAHLSRLYIGIAPKIVVAGSHFDAKYDSQVSATKYQHEDSLKFSFNLKSSGSYSQVINRYRYTKYSHEQLYFVNFPSDEIRPTGIGLGFDFGLTYIIPLGNELATINPDPEKSVLHRSFRFAFSIDDIGVLKYSKDPLRLSTLWQHNKNTRSPGFEGTKFIGSDIQYLKYLDHPGIRPSPVLTADSSNQDSYSVLLPTSINTEMMLQLSRISLMSGLSVGLQNGAFTSTLATFHLGIKAYPLPSLPIRVSTSIARNQPTRLGVGTGVETQHWDFNIGTQFINHPGSSYSFSGGAMAGVQFHF